MTAPAPAAVWIEELAGLLGAPKAEAERFARRVPAGYPQQVSAAQAARDAAKIAALDRATEAGRTLGLERFTVSAGPGGGDERVVLRLRRYAADAIELSDVLPILESFGLIVVEAVPMPIAAGDAGEPAAHIDDFGLRVFSDIPFSEEVDGPRLVEAIDAVNEELTELDSLHRLVLAAGLDWAQVRLLRAYRRYRRQAGSPFSDEQLDDALVAFPEVARLLVRLVETRFDPEAADDEARSGAAAAVRAALVEQLGAVGRLEDDQILRGYLALVDATLRTTYFLRDAGGGIPATVSVKLDSRAVPGLPRPRPEIEAFVHGPAVEGIHLRFGHVARGGLRWSDRAEDFRTEILGLASAQVKKNSVIVPTGAKGGFVCRQPPVPTPADIRRAYETYVSALLDLSDNLVDGQVVSPPGIVRRDGDDPYLVVAADRGTATFSDLANAISEARGFWLGDAFASGGSHGYDHKAMGITAKGAWVAVRRHFHQLNLDVQTETIRVAGVGDMSGDVFGNGMLQSRAIALVAAFDHRHVFIDPDPDPARSYEERARLAGLGRSSWDDYDRAVISEGGGVWSRDAKTVPLHPAARRALGVVAEELSPPEVISAILAAPVDLLWFGGIGTYLKAPGEPDVEVGDHANDAVRITADQVRARVVAEGGNLAVTQRGRIRYSRRGGRINADFIDNAAGVATSDREVNLKILVDLAIRKGRLDASERDDLLSSVEPHVAAEVLRLVGLSVGALNRAVPASAGELDAYEAFIGDLEAAGHVDRAVEQLPGSEELARRRDAGAGLIRPELAVLLSYAKSDLTGAIERSPLPGDPLLRDVVRPYFPPAVVARFDDLIPEHRLYPQLVATAVAGEIVDQMGPVWAHETAAELGIGLAEVAGAYWIARQVLGAGPLLAAIEEAGTSLPADDEAELHRTAMTCVGELARRYLLTDRAQPRLVLPGDEAVAAGQLGGAPGEAEAGGAEGLRQAVERRCDLVDLADALVVAARAGVAAERALVALDALDAGAGIDRLVAALRRLRPPGRWAGWQVRALLDDVAAWRAAAVAGAFAAGDGPEPDVMREWVAARASAFARLRRLLDQLEGLLAGRGAAAEGGAAPDQVALASVVVRRLPR